MSRGSEGSGDGHLHFNNEEGFATRHNLWLHRQETHQQFARLETRLDETFGEFRQRDIYRENQNQARFETLQASIVNLANNRSS